MEVKAGEEGAYVPAGAGEERASQQWMMARDKGKEGKAIHAKGVSVEVAI